MKDREYFTGKMPLCSLDGRTACFCVVAVTLQTEVEGGGKRGRPTY